MSDGTQIAAEIILPYPLEPDARLPTILQITRSWRGFEDLGPSEEARFLAAHGYAVVRADERGTGASFGRWRSPLSRAEGRSYCHSSAILRFEKAFLEFWKGWSLGAC